MNLHKLLTDLDAAPDDCAEQVAAAIVNEVAPYMARLGHADLVRAWVPAAQPDQVRRYLAAAIAATREPADAAPNADYLTVKQAADSLQISERSIARMIERGLPVARIGKAVRIKPAELEHYLSEQETVFD